MSEPKKQIVIFSHGFGVRKDDLGLLSEIASKLPEVESILFDYFIINEKNQTLTIIPLSEQVKKLNEVISQTKKSNPNAIIDLIAHSQGTIIAALAKPKGVRKIIMLAPPFDMDVERSLNKYKAKPGAIINLDGVSRLPASRDGLERIIPAEYWSERRLMKPFEIYNELAEETEVISIEANQDQIVPKVSLNGLSSKIKLDPIDGDHNFSGKDRVVLVEKIRRYIIQQ